jgi:hypothetical protein
VHFTVIQIKLCFPVALQFRDFLGLERLGRCESWVYPVYWRFWTFYNAAVGDLSWGTVAPAVSSDGKRGFNGCGPDFKIFA